MAERNQTSVQRRKTRRPASNRGKSAGKKKRANAGRYKTVAALAVFALAAYTVFSMISLQAELSSARAKLNEKKQAIEQQSAENDELLELLENGSQKELIERAAREKLGYVYAGEEIYENISGN